MATIAPTATVEKSAQLGTGVKIGPGCVIGSDVVIGDDCELRCNVMVVGNVKMGARNRVFANAVLGEEPQYRGCDPSGGELVIGDDNIIREGVTIHRSLPDSSGKTIVGNGVYLMVGSHLGHDVEVGDNVTLCNQCHIGGHCKIEHNVWLSGICATHQFVTIGKYAYGAGMAGMGIDIPPFMRVSGRTPVMVRGLNVIGLERSGFSKETISALMKAYRMLYRRRGNRALASIVAEMISQNGLDENVLYLLEFLQRSAQHRMGRYLEQFRH